MNKLLTRNGKILTYNGGFLTADSLEAMRDCCCGDEPCVPIDDPAAFCASLPQTLTMTVTVNNWSIENWQHPGTYCTGSFSGTRTLTLRSCSGMNAYWVSADNQSDFYMEAPSSYHSGRYGFDFYSTDPAEGVRQVVINGRVINLCPPGFMPKLQGKFPFTSAGGYGKFPNSPCEVTGSIPLDRFTVTLS